MLGTLTDYPGEFFSPGELLPVLRACPAWGEYLNGFETDRGQPAAVGRFLVELGLSKSGHHRTRGSLYACAGTVQRLRHAVEGTDPEPEQQASVAAQPMPDTPRLDIALPQALPVALPRSAAPDILPPSSGMAKPAGTSAFVLSNAPPPAPRSELPLPPPPPAPSVPETAWIPPAGGGVAVGVGTPASNPGAHAAPAPAVIGFRRRASDQGDRGGDSGGAARSGGGNNPPPRPPLGAAATAGAAAPLWVGGGTAVGPGLPPGMPPGMVPGFAGGYGGMAVPYNPVLTAPLAAAEEGAGLPLAFYWHQLRRHLYKILLGAILITTLATFYTLRIPKLYMSVATLRMDFQMPTSSSQSDSSNSSAFDPSTLLQTESADVGLRAVMIQAITSAHLDLNGDLKRELYGKKAATATPQDFDARQDDLVALMQSHVAALVPDNTHNIQISYRSLSPQTSADVANAIANALIDHEFKTRQQEQEKQLAFTQLNFNDVRARTEKEQSDLANFQRANNVLDPSGQNSQEAANFTALNSSFLAAQDTVTKLQAEMDMLATSQKGNNLVEALLSTSDGQALQAPYTALQAAQKNFDAVKLTRGPANPQYQAAQQAVTVAQQTLAQAVAGMQEQVSAQYSRAQHQEELVSKQLQTAKDAMQAFNNHLIDYNQKNHALQSDLELKDKLESQIKQQQVTSSQSSSGLRITDPATPNPVPVYPNVKKNAILALMFSLFFGAGLAILAGYMDRSFTSPDSVEQYLHIPLLGALPQFSGKDSPIAIAQQPGVEEPEGKSGHAPRSAFVEAVLMLRTAVMYAAPQGFRTLSITSSQPQEGKSSVIANLAIAFARHGAKVLLVDCDIRRPSQHRIFEVPNTLGLSSLLRQTAAMEDCFRPTTVERLYLMTAGPAVANPSELVATQLAPVLAALAPEFDYILVDSPPLIGFADAIAIATTVDATLMVARAGKTPRELVQGALQPLKRVRARIIGMALNGVTKSLSPYYSYYSNSSSYYAAREEGE